MSRIRSENLRRVFHARDGDVVAVKGASFEVKEGEIFGLLGPNGAGKTTLLRMLGTIITPTSGECWIDGIAASTAPDSIRRKIGFLSGNTKLYGRLTGREVLRYFGRLYGMPDSAIADRTASLADMLNMHAFLDRRCDTFSTGQSQKVSIARAIFHDPPVLILDEPTLGLDIISSRVIIEFIDQARARGEAIIFSTHYMTEAEMLCDRIGLLFAGEIVALGTQEELLAQTGQTNLHDAFLKAVDGETALPV